MSDLTEGTFEKKANYLLRDLDRVPKPDELINLARRHKLTCDEIDGLRREMVIGFLETCGFNRAEARILTERAWRESLDERVTVDHPYSVGRNVVTIFRQARDVVIDINDERFRPDFRGNITCTRRIAKKFDLRIREDN